MAEQGLVYRALNWRVLRICKMLHKGVPVIVTLQKVASKANEDCLDEFLGLTVCMGLIC